MGVKQLFFEQMRRHLLHPLRLNVSYTPAKQTRGFNQLGGHNPAARFFAELGPRMAIKANAPRAQVPIFFFVFLTQVAQQTAQHGQMQLLVAGGLGIELPALLANHAVQLRMNVTPLTHTPHIDVVFPQKGFVLAVGQFVDRIMATSGITQPLPQL